MKKNQMGRRMAVLGSCTCLMLTVHRQTAQAFDYTFDNGVDVRFDNTVQYSVLERTAPESSAFRLSPNINDGDNNLSAGIVSNRFDLLTRFNISYQGFGFDTTIASFYDTVYNQNTKQGAGSLTYNPANQPSNKFTSATEVQAGRDIQLRNLFIYGSHDIAGIPVTVRVGRLVNLFGESLLFAENGISYGQAPIDIERAASVPNTPAQDLFLPVGQALITAQVTDSVAVSAYYQFEWEKFNFPPAGSYFSTVDFFDEGGQRLIALPATATTPGGYFYRGPDQRGADTGQYGIAVHFVPPGSQLNFGIYALQYNDSEPQVYVRPGAGAPSFIPGTPNALVLGSYQLVYPNHIQIYGASGSTTVGPTNFAGEVSIRKNEPLVSTVEVLPGQNANNGDAPLYATGNVLHYQASAIYLGPANRLWDASSITAEAAGNNLLSFVKNRENFTAGQQHMALGLRSIFTINYFQILPSLDIAPSIGIGWNFMGKSPDTSGFNNTGIDRGGDVTFGISGTYRNLWTGGISYTNYISPPGRDPYADRDFASFNIERTF